MTSGLISVALSLVCGALGAYATLRYAPGPAPAPAASSREATSEPPDATNTGPISKSDTPADTPAPKGETPSGGADLTDRIERLSGRLETIEKQMKDGSAADSSELTTLRLKVAELAKTADEVGQAPGDLRRIDNQVRDMHTQIRTLRDELDAIQTRLERSGLRVRASSSTATGTTPSAPRTEAPRHTAAKPVSAVTGAPTAELARGADLFKRGKYRQAASLFDAMELSHPDDARVWYFAALSQGCASGEWTSAAARLVERGVERERAGTPDRAAIDAAFRDLTTITGREWLAAYRARAKTEEGVDTPEAH